MQAREHAYNFGKTAALQAFGLEKFAGPLSPQVMRGAQLLGQPMPRGLDKIKAVGAAAPVAPVANVQQATTGMAPAMVGGPGAAPGGYTGRQLSLEAPVLNMNRPADQAQALAMRPGARSALKGYIP